MEFRYTKKTEKAAKIEPQGSQNGAKIDQKSSPRATFTDIGEPRFLQYLTVIWLYFRVRGAPESLKKRYRKITLNLVRHF